MMRFLAIFGIWRGSWGSINLGGSELLYEHYAEAMFYELPESRHPGLFQSFQATVLVSLPSLVCLDKPA